MKHHFENDGIELTIYVVDHASHAHAILYHPKYGFVFQTSNFGPWEVCLDLKKSLKELARQNPTHVYLEGFIHFVNEILQNNPPFSR